MTESRRPKLSAKDIEGQTLGIIRRFKPEVLGNPMATLVQEIVQQACEAWGTEFRIEDLGTTDSGHAILGATILRPPSMLVDRSVANTNRYPFVLALPPSPREAEGPRIMVVR